MEGRSGWSDPSIWQRALRRNGQPKSSYKVRLNRSGQATGRQIVYVGRFSALAGSAALQGKPHEYTTARGSRQEVRGQSDDYGMGRPV